MWRRRDKMRRENEEEGVRRDKTEKEEEMFSDEEDEMSEESEKDEGEIEDEKEEEEDRIKLEEIINEFPRVVFKDMNADMCKDVSSGMVKDEVMKKYHERFNNIFHFMINMAKKIRPMFDDTHIVQRMGRTWDHFDEEEYDDAEKMAFQVHKKDLEKRFEHVLEDMIDECIEEEKKKRSAGLISGRFSQYY